MHQFSESATSEQLLNLPWLEDEEKQKIVNLNVLKSWTQEGNKLMICLNYNSVFIFRSSNDFVHPRKSQVGRKVDG